MPEDEPSAAMRTFGRRLMQRRKLLGYTQVELATKLGLTRASIANAEAGRQNLRLATVIDLAFHLDTTVSWLLAEPGPEPVDLYGLHDSLDHLVTVVIGRAQDQMRAGVQRIIDHA